MSGTSEFDFAALLTLCSRWKSEPVPTTRASDPVFERLRQVLQAMRDRPSERPITDLIALLIQVLLRKDKAATDLWIRVPLTTSWPTVQEWRAAWFEVVEDADFLTVRARLPRLPWLGLQQDFFDDVFTRKLSRRPLHVPADPVFVNAMGLPTYTCEGQREAVRALLHLPARCTLIADLPTGSGKSVLAQLPPLLSAEGRLTLVIVPTVALALDQARRMAALFRANDARWIGAPLAFHSGLSSEDRLRVYQAIRSGVQRVLFTSPEGATGSLRVALEEAAAIGQLDHVVIDEAHLVVGWGNGFRPAFQLLPALVTTLRDRAGKRDFRVVLASATLAAATTRTLQQLFGPPEQTYVVAGVHLRPEPRYVFQHFANPWERIERVVEVLRIAPRPFILYVTRPEEAIEWARRLKESGFKRLQVFHGRTPAAERERLLAQWNADEIDGMVATSAFGLGVDKSDVRTIVHATMPESLDRFYQEVGRSGRDGLASASLLLYTPDDIKQAQGMASERLIRDETGLERWRLLIDHAQADDKQSDVFWVPVNRLPAHLSQESVASQKWNMRTLTLMARAGLIELVALSKGSSHLDGDADLESTDQTTHVAVRLLNSLHRDEHVFAQRMAIARDEVWTASSQGLNNMLEVAHGRLEIAAALQTTYAFSGRGAWVPVTTCCGGCPKHWHDREQSVRYTAPHVPRLQQFARRLGTARWTMLLPLAAHNLLVVAVPQGVRYAQQVAELLATLLLTLSPHSVAVERRCEPELRARIVQAMTGTAATTVFMDEFDAREENSVDGGVHEVRILVWSPEHDVPVPRDIWWARCELQVLVMPSNLADPHHPQRLFMDTTAHIHVADLMERLTA